MKGKSRWTRIKILVLLTGTMLALSFLCSDQKLRAAAISDGASVYAANCASCHGSDGRAKTAKGKRSGATDLTSNWNADEARAIRIITNGKGEMPSFKSKLSKEEIASVFGYIRNFRQ
ncbi:MAG: cytochrome c [Pyrinomonadaceae bacterium]